MSIESVLSKKKCEFIKEDTELTKLRTRHHEKREKGNKTGVKGKHRKGREEK